MVGGLKKRRGGRRPGAGRPRTTGSGAAGATSVAVSAETAERLTTIAARRGLPSRAAAVQAMAEEEEEKMALTKDRLEELRDIDRRSPALTAEECGAACAVQGRPLDAGATLAARRGYALAEQMLLDDA